MTTLCVVTVAASVAPVDPSLARASRRSGNGWVCGWWSIPTVPRKFKAAMAQAHPLLAPRPIPCDAASFYGHRIKFNMGQSTTAAKKRPSSAAASFSSRLYQEQFQDIIGQLDLDFPPADAKPRAAPSVALARAVAGRPSVERVMHTQLSARRREESQRAQAIAAEEARRTEVAAKQLEAARQGHQLVAKSLRERQARDAAASAELEAHRSAAAEKQMRRQAALAESVAAAHAEMRSQNEKRTAQRTQASARREAERAVLEERGFNPYLVQRQRDEAARRAKERSKADASQEAKMAHAKQEIAEKLRREKAQRDAQRKAKEAQRPLPYVNPDASGGPRTLCDPSSIELC